VSLAYVILTALGVLSLLVANAPEPISPRCKEREHRSLIGCRNALLDGAPKA
jgi:hypothetical protein